VTAAFVVDTSIAMAWCFEDEATKQTNALLERLEHERAAVPSWWFLEVTNVLALTERKSRITPSKVAEFIALIGTLDLDIDTEAAGRAFTDLLTLCRDYQLTSYDAVYLELANRRRIPLATLDQHLRRAARKAGVDVLPS
jgi:predicted nucleic acid-binding protein